jgi:ubiquinol-cytochrome c reductase cytochrome b subunit
MEDPPARSPFREKELGREEEMAMKNEVVKNEKTGEKGIPFFPNHFLKEVIVMCIVLAGISLLATFFPAPMEEKADPFITPLHIKPEWYFLANYKFLQLAEYFKFLGAWAPKLLGILQQMLIVFIILVFPFVDRNPERHPLKNRFLILSGTFFIVVYIVLLYLGYIK